ncbi:CLUMA_CG018329, isoform A [Clunio marinus]|uniref:CLUMA_CG018329, isoform A n=1 Tax=Clunio marinus TaxID=568069 RepID=A0A1J1IYI2_9DIPT|nr:CLUMA_CG018329, isoform A [Clunio marinus]
MFSSQMKFNEEKRLKKIKDIPLVILEEGSYEKDVLFYVNIGEPQMIGVSFLTDICLQNTSIQTCKVFLSSKSLNTAQWCSSSRGKLLKFCKIIWRLIAPLRMKIKLKNEKFSHDYSPDILRLLRIIL